MARITQDEFSGQADSSDNQIVTIQVNEQEAIEVPSNDFISNAEMSRDGQNLLIDTADGQSLIIEGYFSSEITPLIESPDGSVLTPNLVNSFLNTPAEYAQASTMSDESPVGAVEELNGNATIIRADGTSETATLGTPIYQGDVIETSENGAVNIVFIDETSMAVSESARLAVDEYQFDPSTESGATNLSVLRGVFVFTSGLIGRDDPDDVLIETPVGSIGIRGTIIAGKINPDGESEITVVEGAIVVKNGAMETTLSQQFETVKITGFNDNMQEVGVQKANDVGDTYGSVSDVVPKLFSSIHDASKEAGEADTTTKAEQKEQESVEENLLPEDGQDVSPDETPEGAMMEDMMDMQLDPAMNVMPNSETAYNQNLQTNERLEAFKELAYKAGGRESLADKIMHYNIGADRSDGPAFSFFGPNLYENAQSGTIVAKLVTNTIPTGTNIVFSNGNTTFGNYTIVQTGNIYEIQLTSGVSGPIGSDFGGFTLEARLPGGATIPWNFDATITDVAINLINGTTGPLRNEVSSGTAPVGPLDINDIDGDGDSDIAYISGGNIQVDNSTAGGSIGNVNIAANYESIDLIGDINNDGYADLIGGAPTTGAGSISIIEGSAGGPVTPTPVIGPNLGDKYGHDVAGLGDFDGDGKSDYAVSAIGFDNGGTDRGKVYIETASGTTALNGHIDNMELGEYIDGIGDINGDGLSDLLISGGDQKGYVLFGGSTGNLTTDPTGGVNYINNHGFSIDVSASGQNIIAGGSVGDINGDGFDDFAISVDDGTDINTYAVYGSTALSGTLNLAYLENPDNALKLNHEDLTGVAANNYQIHALGDVDGDGFDDFQVGVDGGTQYTVYGNLGGNAPYVVDGTATDGSSTAGVVASTVDGQSLVGNVDFIDGLHNNLSMKGGSGNNLFDIQSHNFRNIDGGAGTDTISYGVNAGTLDFTNIDFEQVSQVEHIDLTNNASTVRLTVENIFNLLKSSDNGSLTISGVAGGSQLIIDAATNHSDDATGIVAALNEEGIGATHVGTAGGNDHFQIGGYDLYIDTDLATTVV